MSSDVRFPERKCAEVVLAYEQEQREQACLFQRAQLAGTVEILRGGNAKEVDPYLRQ